MSGSGCKVKLDFSCFKKKNKTLKLDFISIVK